MKSLNRTLSLVLVLVMVLGLFGVAGAADFKDNADIKNTEAVNTMAALNIINGKDGNVFDPAGQVTRGEMAKMICVALNGGKEPVLGTTAVPTYTDTKGHWAAGYIEYCTNLGIVAGVGDGTFAPDLAVTGNQAAKMMLVAMNYESDVFGFTGAAWETSVSTEANKAGLFADLSGIDASAALSRDNAAQLIYNGINADTMKKTWKSDGTVTYETSGTSLAEDKFGLITSYGVIEKVAYDGVDKEYDVTFDNTMDADANSYADDLGNFSCDADYSSLFMMNVKVLWKAKSNTNKAVDTIYGVYVDDSAVILSGVVGQLSEATINADNVKLNGTTYKFDNNLDTAAFAKACSDNTTTTPTSPQVATAKTALQSAGLTDVLATFVYDFNDATDVQTLADFYTAATTPATASYAAYTFKAIDTDGNGKIDEIVIYPFTVTKVTYVDSDGATLKNGAEIDFDEDACYTGVAKNDWVKVTAKANTSANKNTYEKITAMEGEVTKNTYTDEGLSKANISGMWFVDITQSNCSRFMVAGSTYENIIQVNTFVFNAELKASSTTGEDYAVVKDVANTDGGYTSYTAKLIFSNGTSKKVDLKDVLDADNYLDPDDDQAYDSFEDWKADYKGALVEYTVNSSNEYTLAAPTATTGGYKADLGDTATYDDDDEKIDGCGIADDAIIFTINASGDEYKVITGKQLKALGDSDVTAIQNAFYTANSSTGYKTIKLAYVTITDDATSDDYSYGYAIESAASYKKDGKTLYQISYWNGTEEVKDAIAERNVFTASITKGTLFKYTMNSDNQMVIEEADVTVGAVTAVDGKNVEITGTTSSKYDADTIFFYVNSAENTYSKGGELQLAKELEGGAYQANVVYIEANDASDPFKLIVVDTKNNIDCGNLGVTTYEITNSTETITAADPKGGYTVTLDKDEAVAGETVTATIKVTTLPTSGTDTLTLTGTNATDISGTVTFKNDAELNSTKTITFTVTADVDDLAVAVTNE